VLIVEDDPATHGALRAILRHYGWDVSVAVSMAEALPVLATDPDVMLLDLMLPDGNGAALLEAIRRRKGATRVIVTTGASEPEQLAEVQALGPDAMLRKPIDLPALLRALQR
jgi:two-component system KDP operon response regulator KdpE